MTQNQYFDLNYFIASLLYAQAQQFGFENPHRLKDSEEPSVSYSATVASQSQSNLNHKKQKNEKKPRGDDEEEQQTEAHHLSSGKLLFDALTLCQPPRFQWNV